ncbi:aldo/keto reductase [Kosmotoga arenicorallina S304]|uniref:Aldo/keto reductase n=1 Tax=Kosmotoga arenicorallina S304 TaxID=1453497 RepID=A0A182C7I9_9BACT|nr:aldo/keto reductase [Kosmotoga arenicorallina]OAA31578.1 aldo/keto reductase [Kosmotoga arenicorallina S304]
MVFKELGNTGERIPVLGLGTWGIGGFEMPDHSKDRQTIGLLEEAIEMGYTHIDTAEYYAAGHTEELIGDAIQAFPREKLFIVSKVWPTHLSAKDLPRALKASLKRLKIEYIDLYLIHWYNPDVPLRETLTAMAEMKKLGFIRHIGVSNFNTSQLKDAISVSPEEIVCNQVLYNIEDREPETSLLPYCQEAGITLTAYSPLRRKVISEHIRRILEEASEEYNASIYQIMLAWLLAKERVVTIPKASSVEHLEENLQSLELLENFELKI